MINLADLGNLDAVNASGTAYPPDEDEFAALGIEREPSVAVRPPRVAGSPVAIECRTEGTVEFDESVVVFGRVVHLAISEAVLDGDHPDIGKLAPMARLGRNEWSEIGKVHRIDRIPRIGRAESGARPSNAHFVPVCGAKWVLAAGETQPREAKAPVSTLKRVAGPLGFLDHRLGYPGCDVTVEDRGDDVVLGRSSPTTSAMPRAAAIFISSVICGAPASKARRGRFPTEHALLIWFG